MPKIVHIVLWKLSSRLPTEEAVASIENLKSLSAPGRLVCELGHTLVPEEKKGGYDYGLYSVFDSWDSLKAYAVSEEHVHAVKNHVRPATEKVLNFDWEMPELL